MEGVREARSRRFRVDVAVAVVLLLGPLAPAAAGSAGTRSLTTGFADSLYADPSPEVRGYWFDRTIDAGARIVRIAAGWRDVTTRWAPANPGNPADPGYDFSYVDLAVRDAAARGLDVLLTVAGTPVWAEGHDEPPDSIAPPGTFKPQPALFADFAHAVAIRYSGSFRPNRTSPPLPRVRYYQAWNEPNLWTYLTPQWDGRRAASPAHYRRMLNAFYDAVKGVNPDNLVVAAGTAPYGTRRGGNLMRPLRFWRALLCLRTRRNGNTTPGQCSEPARFDIAAHHPITGAPRTRADHRDDATIPDLHRLRRIIRQAERSGRALGARRHPLWVTEIWWESDPPDPAGVKVRKQARWIAEALYLIWKQGVRTAILLKVRDDSADPVTAPEALHSGIFYPDATPKPSFSAARFPFVTDPLDDRRSAVAWGRAPRSGRLVIERRVGHRWRSVKSLDVKAGEVFTTPVRVRGPARLRAVTAGETSLVWHQRH